jgi:DNA polymerase delta subunit 1
MNWVELPAAKYGVRTGTNKISNCQIECQVSYRDIISHTPEGEWAKIAPLRVLSFDIECAGRPGIFPEASTDPVIQIANVVTTYGTHSPLPDVTNISNLEAPQNHLFEMCLRSIRVHRS